MLRLANQHTVVPVEIIDRVPFINMYVYVGTNKPRSLQLATPPSETHSSSRMERKPNVAQSNEEGNGEDELR